MTALKLISGDLLFAFGLLVVAALVVLLYRMSFLPKKSVPYLLAALGAALGVRFFKKLRGQALDQKIKETEQSITTRKAKLETLGIIDGTADEEALAAQ